MSVIVVMGVSGSGKSLVGRQLADRLTVPFCEGDDLHPAANIAKMKAGHPLDDVDRAPWLSRVAGWIVDHPTGGVVIPTCIDQNRRVHLRRPMVMMRQG
jgi:gluconokinase